MSERSGIMLVLLLVAGYNVNDQRFFRNVPGITLSSFIVSSFIAIIAYAVLVLFFKKRHK